VLRERTGRSRTTAAVQVGERSVRVGEDVADVRRSKRKRRKSSGPTSRYAMLVHMSACGDILRLKVGGNIPMKIISSISIQRSKMRGQ
jgi:hypothetical protein